MVYQRRGGESAGVLAHLAQRVRREKRRPNLFPRSAVAFVAVRVAVVFIVSLGFLLSVGFTVAAARQLWAAGTGAGFRWFVGHENLRIERGRPDRNALIDFSLL